MAMLAKDVMSTKPNYLPPTATLTEAATEMLSHDYGFMPIGENDRLIGALTDRDIAINAVAKGWDPKAKTVRDVMHKGVYYCMEDDPLEKVVQQMESLKVRRLIVLNKQKRMTGIISLGDIAVKCKDDKLCHDLTESLGPH